MMGESDPQRSMFYSLSLESFVPAEHPLRRIRPLIDDSAIRQAWLPLDSEIGRPSVPPEQLILALIGGYLLGIPSHYSEGNLLRLLAVLVRSEATGRRSPLNGNAFAGQRERCEPGHSSPRVVPKGGLCT